VVRTLSPERRALILSCALTLFAANGVTATSTAQIAKDAGIAAGTLFLYFSTKQELLDELVAMIAADQSASIKARLTPALSTRETFSTIWQGTVDWFAANPDAYRYQQQVRDTALISDMAVQASARSLSYYFEAIEKGLREGAIKPYPADLIGGFLYQGLVAVMNHIRTHPDPDRREETIRQGFEIFWDGIRSDRDTATGNESSQS
jgi:AcrR family transcriptional regulator